MSFKLIIASLTWSHCHLFLCARQGPAVVLQEVSFIHLVYMFLTDISAIIYYCFISANVILKEEMLDKNLAVNIEGGTYTERTFRAIAMATVFHLLQVSEI